LPLEHCTQRTGISSEFEYLTEIDKAGESQSPPKSELMILIFISRIEVLLKN